MKLAGVAGPPGTRPVCFIASFGGSVGLPSHSLVGRPPINTFKKLAVVLLNATV